MIMCMRERQSKAELPLILVHQSCLSAHAIHFLQQNRLWTPNLPHPQEKHSPTPINFIPSSSSSPPFLVFSSLPLSLLVFLQTKSPLSHFPHTNKNQLAPRTKLPNHSSIYIIITLASYISYPSKPSSLPQFLTLPYILTPPSSPCHPRCQHQHLDQIQYQGFKN